MNQFQFCINPHITFEDASSHKVVMSMQGTEVASDGPG